jgi:murein DD-endopeptidase MepM/ murein hydrolase activator NlpD
VAAAATAPGGGSAYSGAVGAPWPTPDASQAKDHYWLGRPTGEGTTQWASPFYPYGSTGQGQYLLHHGADIVNSLGTPLLAPADGTVLFAGPDDQVAVGPTTDFYGNTFIMELDRRYRDQPVYVLLGHMQSVAVQVGQHVSRGQKVGEVGMTGIALGPHVHVEVRVGENDYRHTRNSEFWLETLPGHGSLAGRVLNAQGRHLPEVPILLYPGPSFTTPRYYVYTYADAPGQINPDDEWGENFLLADLPAGTYKVEVDLGTRVYTQEITIQAGKTTWMEVPPE